MQISRPAWQRVLAILACLVFILCFYGRLTAQAVFVVDDLVIGGVTVASLSLVASLLLIGLAGSELEGPIGEAASSAGQNAKEFISAKAEQWINATQGDPTNFIKGIADAVLYNPDGTLVFGPAAGAAVDAFGNWLIDNDYIEISGSSSGDIDFPDLNGTFSIENLADFTEVYDYVITASGRPGITYINDSKSTLDNFVSENNGKVFVVQSSIGYDYGGAGRIFIYAFNLHVGDSATIGNSYTGCQVLRSITASSSASSNILVNSWDLASNSSAVLQNNELGNNFVRYSNINAASSTGSSNGLDVWNDDTATDGWVLDPTGLIGDAVSDLTGAIANVGDYIDTLADVIAGVADVALPVAGVGDIPIPVVGDITIPVDPAIPADRADAVPTTGEQAGEDTPYAGTGDYTLPLADFFPFCIPFDIYKMLSLLAADPVAPSFTWQFYTPGGGTIPIDVDLSVFDSVAQVLRTMETLAFCVGLAVGTKNLLFGS